MDTITKVDRTLLTSLLEATDSSNPMLARNFWNQNFSLAHTPYVLLSCAMKIEETDNTIRRVQSAIEARVMLLVNSLTLGVYEEHKNSLIKSWLEYLQTNPRWFTRADLLMAILSGSIDVIPKIHKANPDFIKESLTTCPQLTPLELAEKHGKWGCYRVIASLYRKLTNEHLPQYSTSSLEVAINRFVAIEDMGNSILDYVGDTIKADIFTQARKMNCLNLIFNNVSSPTSTPEEQQKWLYLAGFLESHEHPDECFSLGAYLETCSPKYLPMARRMFLYGVPSQEIQINFRIILWHIMRDPENIIFSRLSNDLIIKIFAYCPTFERPALLPALQRELRFFTNKSDPLEKHLCTVPIEWYRDAIHKIFEESRCPSCEHFSQELDQAARDRTKTPYEIKLSLHSQINQFIRRKNCREHSNTIQILYQAKILTEAQRSQIYTYYKQKSHPSNPKMADSLTENETPAPHFKGSS